MSANGPGSDLETIQFAGFQLDRNLRALLRDGVRVKLTPKPFLALEYLIDHRSRVVSKQELLEAVWASHQEPNTVEQAISQLRRALGDSAAEPQFIETVAGQGYRFIARLTSDIPPTVAVDGAKFTISRRTMIVGAGGALAAGGIGLIAKHRSGSEVERAVLAGRTLTALDGAGRTLWTYPFGRRLAGLIDPLDEETWRVQILDLENEGRPGVLAACSFVEDGNAGPGIRDELCYFSHDGRLRWTLPCKPELLDCNGHRFEPAWRFSSLLTTPSEKGWKIWAGILNDLRFAGCLLSIDARGRSKVQIAHAGHVQALTSVSRPEGLNIIFGGVNNAFDRTCVGAIRADDPPCVAPSAGMPRYLFANAPVGLPRTYILLSTLDVSRASGKAYAHVSRLTHNGAKIAAYLDLIFRPKASLLCLFGEDLSPGTLMPGGDYEWVHDQLERQGFLTHPWSECPELKQPVKLRYFKPERGWYEQSAQWRLSTNTV